MPSQRLPLSRKFLIALLSVVLPFYIILSILSHTSQIRPSSAARDPQATDIIELNHTLVPLEAHIMSKCPDARDCLRDLVVPAMEEVVEKVNFTLSFIGSVDNNDSIHCMHGPSECLGNMLSLCAIDLYPTDPVRYLGFSNCLISSYAKIPSRELVEPCALEHGVDFEDLNSCVSEDGKGLDLLMSSVDRSQSAGVKRSCTVRVNNKTWCVRDGGEWKDCPGGSNPKNLVEEVERLYQE
ncbi:MAG: hypothetical protein L6R40_004195 [Gallowayella cf. fulva]|nr:MAG: hypothetical protein L6R40_004195 [Xanthomendoza cf. fulva]